MINNKWLHRQLAESAVSWKRRWLMCLSFVIYRLSFIYLAFIINFLLFYPQGAFAQFNTERVIMMGRAALYYEDYVLSIQYFNQAITSRPHLYEPWFYRGVAKYQLDDFAGAESDCSKALDINPYVVSIYELRGLCRIRQNKFQQAVDDYNQALKYDPENQGLWHNRVLCHIQDSNYTAALVDLDTMLTRWSHYAKGYAMRGEVYLMQKDTVQAIQAFERSLEEDPYDGSTWAARSIISLAQQQWKEAETSLDKAVHLMPKHAGNYINRALARYNQNNLRGAMADYDTALDLDPNNFLGHYNRGLLRAQVGDDNRGIEDFDFVLNLEPDNLMALFNRGLLREKTGDLRGAISDYSKVIDQYPNFWTGLLSRAECYRRLGMTRQAELDEFRVLKAQMDKRYGTGQSRQTKQRSMRKRSDDDLDKYNQLVVADEQEVEHEYKNAYRGRVQDHQVDMAYQPVFGLSFEPDKPEVKQQTILFEHVIDQFNQQSGDQQLYISSQQQVLTAEGSQQRFAYIDSLTILIGQNNDMNIVRRLLMFRAVGRSSLQNYEEAIGDLNTLIEMDSTQVLAYWQRAVCQLRISEFQAAQGTNVDMRLASAVNDVSDAILLDDSNPYLYYNRGNIYVLRHDLPHAIADYDRALALDPNLGEAWYNRGLARLDMKQTSEGIADLSKAGELGLYKAYSVIKKMRK